jgi:phosphate acetyltransferase
MSFEEGFLEPVLVGRVEEVDAAAKEGDFLLRGTDIRPCHIRGMMKWSRNWLTAKREMTEEECRAALQKGNYFGLHAGQNSEGSCTSGRSQIFTADTVRPALQLIKTRPETTSYHLPLSW